MRRKRVIPSQILVSKQLEQNRDGLGANSTVGAFSLLLPLERPAGAAEGL